MPARNMVGLVGGLALLCALAGCESRYTAVTVLHPDGSVDREISQPAGEGADEGPRAAGWATIVYRQTSLGAKRNTEFTATGHFASPAGIPDHVAAGPGAEEGHGDLPRSRLQRRYVRHDYVFVDEHDWEETLADTVTFEGMHAARDEVVDLWAGLFRDVFDELLGREYDADDLVWWIRTHGRNWLAEVTDAAFVDALAEARRSKPREFAGLPGDTFRDVAAICARRGLRIERDGEPLDLGELERAIEDYAVQLVTRTVKRRDNGRFVDGATARKWVDELVSTRPLGKEDASDPKAEHKPSRIELAATKVIDARYGGATALASRCAVLTARLLGVYWPQVPNFCRFDYSMSVPGRIVRTTGELLDPDPAAPDAERVRWRFDGRLAYPLGYVMACRSVQPDSTIQRRLLGGEPLGGREAMLAFIELVGDERPAADAARAEGAVTTTTNRATTAPADARTLVDVLRDCRGAGSMTPLYAYRDSLPRPAEGESPRVAKVNRLLDLLKLPRRAPPPPPPPG